MELTPLRYLSVIAREGHLTRAAALVGVTQPALSAMLKKLEQEVGAELMHRTARGVELTEAGRLFLEHAEQSVRSADAGVEAVRELLGLERGSIRVGGGATVTTYVLPGVISSFRGEHPGVRFYVREGGSREVALSVALGELDLGVVTMPVGHGGDDRLIARTLLEDELVLIAPPGHGLSGRKTFRWADLQGQAMVAFEASSAVRQVIDQSLAAAGVSVEVVMELRSIESIKRMVREGVGVALVSRHALSAGEGLRCRDGRVVRTLAIVRRGDRVPGPSVAAFEEALLSWVGKRAK